MKIDIHSHILPGIDDGSIDMDMTEQMLDLEKEQGVSHIYATPHFYAHRISVESFLERRAKALEKTRRLISTRPELPAITAGAEVLCFGGIGKAEQIGSLCIEGTDILLLEMPFTQWSREMTRDVEKLTERFRVVLAHVERYEQFQKDMSAYREILAMPLTIQINAGSFTAPGFSGRRRQKLAFSLLADHDKCIIGSDCHNLTDRRPNLASARESIENKAGTERLTQLDAYTEELLGNSGDEA
jgi:protein-tyrosine phosphatase